MSTPAARIMPAPRLNTVFLPEGVVREMRPSSQSRPVSFTDHFEDKVLFYDVFWHENGRTVLMVGPPPVDLDTRYGRMVCVALPSGRRLAWREHNSKRVRLCAGKAPLGTSHIRIHYAGGSQDVVVGPNRSAFFAGRRVLFAISKNNKLDWIRDWARFHAVNQGTDAVILFDNGSTDYGGQDLEEVLARVPGIERVAVLSAPFPFGRQDEWIPKDQFWSQFLQPALFLVMFRRFGQTAYGMLNCDIDELAIPGPDGDVYEAAAQSCSGTAYFGGAWVAPVPEVNSTPPFRHAHFRRLEADLTAGMGRAHKWAMVPNRWWLQRLNVHPYPHSLQNRPLFGRRHISSAAYIAHFRGISTSWKYERQIAAATADGLAVEPALTRALNRAFREGK